MSALTQAPSTTITPNNSKPIITLTTLPTPSQADEALGEFASQISSASISIPKKPSPKALVLSCNERWKQICLVTLSYGTDYNLKRNQRPSLKLKIRATKALQFLIDCLLRYDAKYFNSSNDEDADEREDVGIESIDPRVVLADAIWLVGCVLKPSEDSGSNMSSSMEDNDELLAAFCYIVKGLAGLKVDPSPNYNTTTATTTNTKQQQSQQQFTALCHRVRIPIPLLHTVLESNVLKACDLLVSEEIFAKRMRRVTTEFYYRQRRFNLLAEESEGYAKLLSLLLSLPLVCEQTNKTTTYPNTNNSSSTGSDREENLVAEAATAEVLARVRELVGAFDLDPNRALDLILDAIEAELDRSANPIPRNKPSPPTPSPSSSGPSLNLSLNILIQILGEFNTNSIPHLLGFKLASYTTIDSEEETPASLYQTCAFLAAHGMVQISDLIPHLHPNLSTLIACNKKSAKHVATRLKNLGAISLNSAKDATDSATVENQSGSTMDITKNQRLGLINALLSFGAFPLALNMILQLRKSGIDAIFLLPSIGTNICQMLHAVIEPIYRSTTNPPRHLSMVHNTPPPMTNTLSKRRKNLTKPGDSIRGKMSLLPTNSVLLPIHEIDRFVEVVYEPLKLLGAGASIGKDPVLYCKLCRLFRYFLKREIDAGKSVDQVVTGKTLNIIESFLVPSVSMFHSNPAICSELWNCLELLPYPIRYKLYDAWRGPSLEHKAVSKQALSGDGYSLLDDKPFSRVETEINTGLSCRYVLRRLSKDTIKDMGKRLAKAAHNNPIVVFSSVLSQIESYDNLVGLMVDTFKFVTNLALDVLGYCILTSLGGGKGGDRGRSKLKSDGVNAAQWLSSLEQFTGAFWKKFPEVDIRGVLSFLLRRLQEGHTLELGVLRTLLTTAGGLDVVEGGTGCLSVIQLEGRAGSQLLKRETSSFGVVDKVNKKSASRLREVLQQGNTGIPLLIMLAQIRQKILFKTSKKDIKLIGNLYDSCYTVLGLLLEFLTIPGEWEDPSSPEVITNFGSVLPSLGDLMSVYGLDTAMAWTLGRPLVRAAMIAEESIREKMEQEEGESMDLEKDSGKATEQEIPEMLRPWLPCSPKMIQTYSSMLPEHAWKYLSPSLFETFWSHDLYDVFTPRSRYEAVITRLKKEAERLTALQQKRPRQGEITFQKADEMELERVKKHSHRLKIEQNIQVEHVRSIKHKFQGLKDGFLSSLQPTEVLEHTAQAFLTHCVLPRCLLSPEDAMFGARFVQILHNLDTPSFYTLQFIDRLVTVCVGSLFCITEDEAGNLAVLLYETWITVSGWRYNEKYEKDVKKMQGSIMNEVDQPTSFEEFVELYNTWHTSLGDALVGCLKSKEYIHTRAALIVLSRLVRVYPTRPSIGEQMFHHLKPLQEDDRRQDLKAMANAYAAQLMKARDDGVWKEENADQAKERLEAEQAKLEERKLKAEQTKKDMENDKFWKQPQPQPWRGTGHPPSNANPRNPRLGDPHRRHEYPHQRGNFDRRPPEHGDRGPPSHGRDGGGGINRPLRPGGSVGIRPIPPPPPATGGGKPGLGGRWERGGSGAPPPGARHKVDGRGGSGGGGDHGEPQAKKQKTFTERASPPRGAGERTRNGTNNTTGGDGGHGRPHTGDSRRSGTSSRRTGGGREGSSGRR